MRSFNVLYDKKGDVLYISTVDAPAARGVRDRGLLWRYAGTGELIGVTILDYRDFWYDRRKELAQEIARKFDMPAEATQRVLEHAVE
jgi:hypothetical protein